MKTFVAFMLAIFMTFFTGSKDNNLVVETDTNKENITVLTQTYDYVYDFHDGFARVMKDNKCGVVDTKGNEIVPCVYDWIFFEEFSYESDAKNIHCIIPSNLFITFKDGKYGFVDKTGKELTECKYDYMYYYHSDKMIKVCKDGKIRFHR